MFFWGLAQVKYKTYEQAQAAVKKLNDHTFKGVKISAVLGNTNVTEVEFIFTVVVFLW